MPPPDQHYYMGEVVLEKGKVLKVYFVCATAVQSQLFSYVDFLLLHQPPLNITMFWFMFLDEIIGRGIFFRGGAKKI